MSSRWEWARLLELSGRSTETRSGFTFCVRAAKQVKELGYAHNLRVVLRKWPKIWSCDGLFARSGEETEDSDRVLGETC